MSLPEQPLFEVSRIETPEQIEIDLPLAGVGTRGLAYAVDLALQLVPLVFLAVFAYVLLPAESRPSDLFVERTGRRGYELDRLALAFISVVVFVMNFGYFALFELWWRGQTPGKRALGLRVLRDGGYPIDGRAALVRNLLRVVDIFPTAYLVGAVALFAGRQGKRVGDYAAGTIVVKQRSAPFALAAAEAQSPGSAEPRAGLLSPDERRLVEQFLGRRHELSPRARARLAAQLAAPIASRLGHAAPAQPEQYLERVATA